MAFFVSLSRLVVAAAVLLPLAAQAAPKSKLIDERWTEYTAGSGTTVDHDAWDGFLARYVAPGPDGVARVDYGAVTAADRTTLDRYVAALEATEPATLDRREQLAYWFNLYNALTVRLILDHHPVESIRRIWSGFFDPGPWDEEITTVAGQALSLDDIEHGIVRPIWRDPRIHYAFNCAAIGCPDLRDRAWRGADIDAALDTAARAFVNHARGAQVRDGRLAVSSIYHWYEADFGGNDAGVIAHLAQHADPELAAALTTITRIAAHDYDWTLNDAP